MFKHAIVAILVSCGAFTGVYAQTTWSSQSSGTASGLYGIGWSGSQFVAVGFGGTYSYSSGGTTIWSLGTLPITTQQNALVFGDSQFVSVGNGGSILTWPNGGNWTVQSSGTTNALYGVIWTGSQFAAVGASGTFLTSPDGVVWTTGNTGTTTSLNSIVWTGNQFVAVGIGGLILSSPNGVTWTTRTSGTTNALLDIIWTGTQLTAVGANATILTSPNGVAWTAVHTTGTNELYGVTWTGSQLVAVGARDTILTSPSGMTWTTRTSGTTNSTLYKLVSTPTLIVGVSGAGTILTSSQNTAVAPTLNTPNPGSVNVPITTNLTWTAFAGATSYRLQVSTDSTFATTTVNDSTTKLTVAVGPLANSSVYYWRVNATSAGGISAYSALSKFTTAAPAGISQNDFAAQDLDLKSDESLSFALPQRERVVIQVFNTQGQMVSRLLDETRDAGSYTVPLSSELKGSLYILDFRAGNYHQTMKIHP